MLARAHGQLLISSAGGHTDGSHLLSFRDESAHDHLVCILQGWQDGNRHKAENLIAQPIPRKTAKFPHVSIGMQSSGQFLVTIILLHHPDYIVNGRLVL